MPLPLALGAIAGSSAGTYINGALAAVGLSAVYNRVKPYIDEILNSESFKSYLLSYVSGIICDEVFNRTGLILDANDPLTKASFTNAISAKIGIPITDLTNAEKIQEDLGDYLALTINSRAGTEFTQLRITSPAQLKEDLSIEFTNQFGKALAGAPSLLSVGDTSTIRAMALAGTSESGEPVTIPYTTKRLLAARSASKKSYNKKRTEGKKRVWIQLPTEPVEEP
jgi:hypothetical protein